MTNPPKDTDKLPDAEADARFKRLVGNLVNTPHKPHAPSKRDRAPLTIPVSEPVLQPNGSFRDEVVGETPNLALGGKVSKGRTAVRRSPRRTSRP